MLRSSEDVVDHVREALQRGAAFFRERPFSWSRAMPTTAGRAGRGSPVVALRRKGRGRVLEVAGCHAPASPAALPPLLESGSVPVASLRISTVKPRWAAWRDVVSTHMLVM